MRKTGLIYPYNRQVTPILRYGSLNGEFDALKLVAPEGWGMNGKDASRADDGEHIGLTVKSDFEGELEDCDTVILCEYTLSLDFKKYIYPKIIKSVHKKKDLICLARLDTEVEHELRNICAENNVNFTCYGNTYSQNESDRRVSGLEAIGVPVIFVLGVGERANKFEIQLALRRYYLENGYKVSQIGTRQYCEWLGFHSFPRFMTDKSLSEVQKVFHFNNYVKRIEEMEDPDLIIIGIPGGIMPINQMFVQDFGILAYEVSCAVTPDAAVLSLYYDQYEQGFFENIDTSIKCKFGFEIDCFNIANVKFDWAKSMEKGFLSYLSLSPEHVRKKISVLNTLEKPVFNVLDTHDAHAAGQFTQSRLEKYAEVSMVNEI